MDASKNAHLRKIGFQKGDSRINRSGRPLNFKEELRRLVGNNGEKAYKLIWEIAQGEASAESIKRDPFGGYAGHVEIAPSFAVRLDAAKFLVEQLNGKSAQPIEATSTTVAISWDLEKLSEEQLAAIITAGEIATTAPAQIVEGTIVEPSTEKP